MLLTFGTHFYDEPINSVDWLLFLWYPMSPSEISAVGLNMIYCRTIFTWDAASGIRDFVKTLYQNILDRDAESKAAIDFWSKHARFHGIASAIGGFFTSDEFKTKSFPSEVVVDN